ncbi:tyrosine-type recombinase/integrase [Euzebya pacifica]|uniref:tyrosine-type recombinase/integrase n=1 Tax=Euzebya pacifica TaxID=1608957 RepID=UPI001C1F2532|nr:site-specific integrase [Euzebya pacifica]
MLTALYTDLYRAGGREGTCLSVQTVKLVHMAVRKCLADAVDAGELRENPAAKSTRPTRDQHAAMALPGGGKGLRYLDRRQVRVLRSGLAPDQPVSPVIELAIATGLRRGELLGLRWPDVMPEGEADGQLRVRQTLVIVGGSPRFSEPKTAKSRRQFRLGDEGQRVLRQQRARQAEWRLSWPGAWGNDHDLVFTREDGAPLHPDAVSKAFRRIRDRLALSQVRFHDLRHTHATLALEAGLPVKVLSERLGHSSVQITWDTYAHVMPGQDVEFADRFDKHVYGTG